MSWQDSYLYLIATFSTFSSCDTTMGRKHIRTRWLNVWLSPLRTMCWVCGSKINYLSHLFLLLLFRCDLLCPMLERNHKQAIKSSCKNTFNRLSMGWVYCSARRTTSQRSLTSSVMQFMQVCHWNIHEKRAKTEYSFTVIKHSRNPDNAIACHALCRQSTRADLRGLPFGLVLQGLQEGAGPTSPHLDVGGGCTADRDRKWASSTAVKAVKTKQVGEEGVK